MNYTIRIKRQENPQASPCWQEFSFEGRKCGHLDCFGVERAESPQPSVRKERNGRFPHCVGMRLHDTQVRCLCHADQWSASSCLFRFSAGL